VLDVLEQRNLGRLPPEPPRRECARGRVVRPDERGEKAEPLSHLLGRCRGDRQRQVPPDRGGDLKERHALVGDAVVAGAGLPILKGLHEQPRRVQTMHRWPPVAALAGVAGHAVLAGVADDLRQEAVVAVAVDEGRQPHQAGPHTAPRKVGDRLFSGAARPAIRGRIDVQVLRGNPASSGHGLRVDRLRMTCHVITVDRMACRVIYDRRMGRWEPDARDRLEHAALELFLDHGFDRVTVPEITARAGLTTRTFHRHFADKREVLFADADQFSTFASRLVLQAPAHLGPIDVVAQGLPTLATAFEGRLEQLKLRKAIIDTHDGLRERELRKMEALVDAITNAFRDRGVDDRTAAVVAETAVGVVKVALRRWIASTGQEPLHTIMTDSLTRIGGAFHQFHPR